ncbi:Rpn family recombination-promoting nuclease/putative transposase [Enterobacteriaceae bacterium BIT-l23]|uniref:Rpn family recombination-promoting nuclease/putative transposase n=1 Tax=Jejubacter sp. L23 TaxID=3092086 RepID=UPI0015859C28|nr:Rpn family recombination-promoting nuclease/putative transposase [Enterobacteriaceae bacterium BIT-l23]
MGSAAATTPHDAVFRQLLSHPDTARDFIALHLPCWLRDICDPSTLRLVSGNFVEQSLRPFYSDVLWRMKTADGKGYIYLLIEHQSTPDKLMAFRLIRYAIATMQRHLDEGHRTLPLVIPALFYQGKLHCWPWSLRWFDAFCDPVGARRLYNSPLPLVDIQALSDAEILRHRSLAALTLLQKHIRRRDLTALMDKLAQLLQDSETPSQHVDALINYLLLAGKARVPARLLRQLATRLPKEREQSMQTIAQYLERKGHRKGKRQGDREARLHIAQKLLSTGMAPTEIAQITGLALEELAKLGEAPRH